MTLTEKYVKINDTKGNILLQQNIKKLAGFDNKIDSLVKKMRSYQVKWSLHKTHQKCYKKLNKKLTKDSLNLQGNCINLNNIQGGNV